MSRNKFKKQLKSVHEIKANKSKPYILEHMLRELNKIPGAKSDFVVLEKSKVYSKFLLNDNNKLYNYVAGCLAKNILLHKVDLAVRIDKSKGKQLLREDFNSYFEAKLKESSFLGRVEIHHSESHAWNGLQFADVLAWSMFQKFENNQSRFIDLLALPV